MISDQPLPEGHTARRLAYALTEAGAPPDMIRRAERGYYHDYLSPLTFPEIELVNELNKAAKKAPSEIAAKLRTLAAKVINGEYDANKAESDEWARSPEGQETLKQFGLGNDNAAN
jgi:hypothetical protein